MYVVVCVILGLAIFVELRLVTDGRTDGQTHDDSIYCASIASRGKNEQNKCVIYVTLCRFAQN